MDQARIREAEYRLTHRHSDGSWSEMVESPLQHDPAAHDPERRWGIGRLFRCASCEAGVRVVPEDEVGTPVAEV